jgi:hypothetical protein
MFRDNLRWTRQQSTLDKNMIKSGGFFNLFSTSLVLYIIKLSKNKNCDLIIVDHTCSHFDHLILSYFSEGRNLKIIALENSYVFEVH